MGLLLACDRRIPDQVAELRQGKWNKAAYSKGRGLVWPNAWDRRAGSDRPGGGGARPGLRHAGRGLVA